MSSLNSKNINLKNKVLRNNIENNNKIPKNNQKNNYINGNNTTNSTSCTRKEKKNEPVFIYKIHADNAHEFIMKSKRRLISNFNIFLIIVMGFFLYISIKKKQIIFCIIILLLFILLIHVKLNTIVEESLLVVRDLGVQIKTTYPFNRTYSRFIDKSKIGQIIINEGITAFEVNFYLAVLISGEDHMEVVYKSLIPKLQILKFIYKESNEILKPNFLKDQLGLL